MGNGFQFIDIILFAMIAAFLILRLRSVLGRRDGHEGGYRDPFNRDASDEAGDDNVVQLPDRRDEFGEDVPLPGDQPGTEEVLADDTLAAGVSQIRRHDPSFNIEDFLVGARVAFEMILGSYASGDRETLENLLSPEVLANFTRAIDDREAAGHVLDDTLVGIRNADIVEAFVEGEAANITVKFVSEQVNVTRDGQGHVIDGSPNQVADVVDFWTFARDTRSGDPNWILVATRSLD